MTIEDKIIHTIQKGIESLYGVSAGQAQLQLQKTRKEFTGDFTLVVFPLLKISKKSPELTASEIGDYLVSVQPEIEAYNVIKGFLNLSLSDKFWLELLAQLSQIEDYGISPTAEGSPAVMVEFSSPNTNKPLHLGHIRNNLLGDSISRILKASGRKVVKVNLVNDRGIHICKSMLAWQKSGKKETPESTGKKGDHLVGDYYVEFDKMYKKEISELVTRGLSSEEAEKNSQLMKEAREMLRKWESGDTGVQSALENNEWVGLQRF